MLDVVTLGALLRPALPFLIGAGEHVASRASEALGRGTWEHAQRLWDRLAGAVAAQPSACEAVEDVAANPHDGEAVVALVRQLRKILACDPALAAEVKQLLGEATQAGVVASGARSFAIGGSVSSSTIVTGDNSGVDRR